MIFQLAGQPYEIRYSDPHRHKFGHAMAEFLYTLDDDESTGCTDWAEYVQRFGKRLLFSDDRGFVSCERWPDEKAARARFDEIERAYCKWVESEDYPD